MQSGDATISKVMWRLLPFIMVLFFFSLLDRTNISFAALEMNKDLGLTPKVYGFAAGVFFLGYCLFEIPSNLILERIGARVWLMRIMVTWGIVVAAMAWISGEQSLYVMRFLLGVTEAGLFPGLLLYCKLWIPQRKIGVATSILMSTTAIANVLGGPISTSMMQIHNVFGFTGWQMMFLLQGLLTIVIGFTILWYLPSRIGDATWLSSDEKSWLQRTLADEDRAREGRGVTGFLQGFFSPKVLLTTACCFTLAFCFFGTIFWLPQIIKAFGGLSNMQVGLLTSVPYLIGGVVGIWWGRRSDQNRERKLHLATGAVIAALGYAAAATSVLLGLPTGYQFVGLCIAAIGVCMMLGLFWAFASDLLGGSAAAGGLAFINSIGTLGGFFGPFMIGYIQQLTQSFAGSLFGLAAVALLTGLLALSLRNVVATSDATTLQPAVKAA